MPKTSPKIDKQTDKRPRTSRRKPGLVGVEATTKSGADYSETIPGPVIPNRWVRFLVEWNWNCPDYGPVGRVTKCFRAGTEIRLTRRQWESAQAAGAVTSIPNPGRARPTE